MSSAQKDFSTNTKPPPFRKLHFYSVVPKKYQEKRRLFNREEPIMSYGIVCFFIDNDTPNILLYQRRDTFGYVDIIKGFWNTEDELERLFLLTTEDERERLEMYDFDDIWNDLWVEHTHYVYLREYSRCKIKFEQVKNFILSEKYGKIEFSKDISLEWGFPKGKRLCRETSLECALREFEEETTISKKRVEIVDIEPMVEYYRGSDNKAYGTCYFLCEVKKRYIPQQSVLLDRLRATTLSPEAKTYDWFTIARANRVLIKHHKKIMRRAVKRFEKILCKRRFEKSTTLEHSGENN